MMTTVQEKADGVKRKVRSARIRHFAVLVAEQTAPLMIVVLCLRILQVFLGVSVELSRMAQWAAAAAIVLLMGGIGYRVARRLHPPYDMAQILDARAGLHDSFSTAWFLMANPAYAAGPHAAAHVGYAAKRASEIRLDRLFPLPTKRVALVAVLVGILALAGRITSLPFMRVIPTYVAAASGQDRVETTTASRLNDSGSKSSEINRQMQANTAPLSKTSLADKPGLGMVGAQRLQPGGTDERTPSPNLRRGDDPLPSTTGMGENQDVSAANQGAAQRPYVEPSSVAHPRAMAPGKSEITKLEDARGARTRTPNAGVAAGSLLSQLLFPLVRLIDSAGQRSYPAKADVPPQTTSAPSTRTDVDASHYGGPSQEELSNRQATAPNKPGYSSANASPQQAANRSPASLPPSMGGSHTQAGVISPQKYAALSNVIDLVNANPGGDAGHTRVQADQSTSSRQQMHTSDFDHHSDVGVQIVQDEAPLAYQRSIQAYLQQTRVKRQSSLGR